MTFPAILTATSSVTAGALAMVCGLVLAWRGGSLFKVALGCCSVVLVMGVMGL